MPGENIVKALETGSTREQGTRLSPEERPIPARGGSFSATIVDGTLHANWATLLAFSLKYAETPSGVAIQAASCHAW